MQLLWSHRGFTLVELLIVVAIISVLTAIAIPVYGTVQAQARLAKAQADARALVSAINSYSSHMGGLPPDLNALNLAQTNAQGQTAGPFMNGTPAPPAGWSAYGYSTSTGGTFQITTSGDGTTVAAP